LDQGPSASGGATWWDPATMSEITSAPAQPATVRPLQPIERISEALFGLIMVLTFTCSISAAGAGRDDVRTMVFGAFACNVVWGVIDAVLYLLACLADRGHGIDTFRAVRAASDPRVAHRLIAGALPPVVTSVLQGEDLETIRQRLAQLAEPPRRPRLGKSDWLGAVGVFLWVFLITFPVALPFVFVHDVRLALRVSNVVAVALLFLMGHEFGRVSGLRAWWTGLVMVLLGSALVAATIAMGG
jgi:hypothetical protein